MKKNHLFLFLTILFFSCQKEKIQLVPSEFEPYVDAFFEEAQLRGYDLHKEDFDFSITLEEIEDPFIAGQCRFRGNIITIDESSWMKKDEQEREYVIFHELGHCLLDRQHRNIKTTSNECYSLMRGGRNDDFRCSLNMYSSKWRKYYLDELFNSGVSFPLCYYSNRDYIQPTPQANYLLQWKDTTLQRFEISDIDFQNLENFLLEIDFDILSTEAIYFSFSLSDIRFGGCPRCTASDVFIGYQNENLYESERFGLTSNYKLTMIKRGDYVSFFFNEKFLHVVEYELFEGNELEFSSYKDSMINLSVDVLKF